MRLEPRCSHCDSEDRKSSVCDPVNATADASVSTRVTKFSFAGYGVRMRRSRHDQLLRKSGMQAPLRAGPAQLVLRAVCSMK